MSKKYLPQEKNTIIERHTKFAEPPSKIIADVGISKSTFYRWLSEYQQDSEFQKAVDIRTHNLLKARVERLEKIIEILKSSNVTVKSPMQERLYVAERLSDKYSVRVICDALDIPRGTYYNHILRNKRDNTWYAKRREELRIRIQEIYDESHQIFGAEKITAIIRNEGIKTSKNMVRELMKEMGLISIRQQAKKMYRDESKKKTNYLNQEFDVKAPNQVWVSDVTYFKYGENSYFICAVIDLYARMVVGYKVGKSNSTQLVKSTFKQAYQLRNPDSTLLFHTDRGTNYSSQTFNEYLKSLQITHSFSRAYVPYDNSVMESFFASMKREELYRTKYRSEAELYKAIDEYIIFYNEKRPHAKIQYKTPVQKEEEYYRNI